jgi:DNA-binding transcriptional MerR regulator
MSKSAKAFRNISEVSDWLETPTHVLRFWESKFSQIKPTKRSGGRRYYRPKDMLLIGGIKQLLHIEGHTIKGAKQVLREKGLNYVVGLSRPLDLEVYEKEVELEKPIKDNLEATKLVQGEKNISLASDRALIPTQEVAEQPGLFDFFEAKNQKYNTKPIQLTSKQKLSSSILIAKIENLSREQRNEIVPIMKDLKKLTLSWK